MASAHAHNNAKSASQVILVAEANFVVGKFKVWANQIEPHPGQRHLSQDWVESLAQRFQDVGIDRASHPIKVLLSDDSREVISVVASSIGSDGIPELPRNMTCLVYHGQHRVAACKKLDASERWWYAEVYRPDLEKAHPAEFLTVMHASNEDEYRFPCSDADRFTAMYRLLKMREDNLIDAETYEVNQERLEQSILKDATRQGLHNLLRSAELSEAVAAMLQQAHLRPCFNAATWGKKLVKGRFYKLAACLILEMLEQCRLLKGGWHEVSSKPFQLPAQFCTWKHLQTAVKKKDHPWKELEGGAAQALDRVTSRPSQFFHVINPKGADGWTIENSASSSVSALLPTVLTSDVVATHLSDMYNISQHLIHMVAGKHYLNSYTSNQAHSGEEDHPVGIISITLKKQLQGKPSNYPDKVIYHMWKNQTLLVSGLSDHSIGKAADTNKDEYQELILKNRPWWELLRLFKQRSLDDGLCLKVPKEFPSSQEESTEPKDGSGTVAIDALRSSLSIMAQGAHLSSSSRPENDSAGAGGETGQSLNSSISPNPLLVAGGTNEQQVGASRKPSAKKRRLNQEEEEDHFSPEPSPGLNSLGAGPEAREGTWTLRCHSLALENLQILQNTVPQLQPDEVRALAHLAEQIVRLQGTGCMARVLNTLGEQVLVLTQRAMKANRVANDFEADSDDSSSCE
ncbi:hypothetical protein FRC08_016034 [Ceratobasidium sp. 394]|nr:hypothetical protein FRC08_016034 [Ceratobasidium sp. 394]